MPEADSSEGEPARPMSREERIRERAYLLWEQDGRPEDAAEEYWHRSQAIEAAMDQQADEASAESFPASDPPARTPETGTGRGGR